jgi:hypothetical protein
MMKRKESNSTCHDVKGGESTFCHDEKKEKRLPLPTMMKRKERSTTCHDEKQERPSFCDDEKDRETTISNDEKNGEKHNLLWGNEGENYSLS